MQKGVLLRSEERVLVNDLVVSKGIIVNYWILTRLPSTCEKGGFLSYVYCKELDAMFSDARDGILFSSGCSCTTLICNRPARCSGIECLSDVSTLMLVALFFLEKGLIFSCS